MSVSAIASNPLLTPQTTPDGAAALPGPLQAVATNFNSLGQALQAGDLAGAQQAFAALVQSVPAGAVPSGAPQDQTVGADMVALGQSLQAGDLSGAQQAFTNLQQALRSADQAHGSGRGHHHGRVGGSGGGGGGGAGDVADLGASDPSDATASSTVTQQVSVPNPDGTVTLTITYADGTTVRTIQPGAAPTSTSALDPANAGQRDALLQAQAQASTA